MLAGGFGVTEFQLVLLRRMADYQPALVERARGRLGVRRGDMRAANAHWQRLIRSPRAPSGLRRHQQVLGPPETAERRRIGDLTCLVARWRLPLWPDLRFEVVAIAPHGPELHGWLVRAPGAPAPPLRGIADLAPWACVVGDVERALGPVEHREGDAPSRWRTTFTVPDLAGRPARASATFTHGLLQVVELTADASGAAKS